MTWLAPSVIATLISTLVLSLVYFILASIEGKKYLWFWFWAWILSSIHFFFMLLYIYYPEISLYTLLNLNFSLYSGLLLYSGIILWQKLKLKKSVIITGLVLSITSVIGAYYKIDFFYQTAPIFFYMGVVYLILGWSYFKQKGSKLNNLIGFCFIVWGLHKMDYPLIRQITILAPWGYLLGAILSLLIAVSMILLYLTNTKNALIDLNKELQIDIQKRKKVELENIKYKKMVEETNKVKEKFLANISHELLTPLNGAIGMIDLLNNLEQTEENSYYLNLAAESVDHLCSIVKDLLDFVQIDSGKLGLIIESFDFEKMIVCAVGLFETRLKEKNISVVCLNKGKTNIFTGDRARTAQIIISLLSNAVKFSKGGTISISYTLEPGLNLSITDEGIGIAEEKIDNIFNTLEQLEDPYTKHYNGLGMGLAIVKNLIDLMKGKLDVTSILGKGSVFYITIPVSEIIPFKAEQKDDTYQTESEYPGNFHILIAEDEGINRLFVREILKRNNFHVLEAKNGKEVLNIVKTKNPDLILMDINMPVLNGIDATIELRKIEKLNKTPILALTAYTEKDDITRFIAAGFNEVLEKPINEKNLIKKIKEYAYR